MKRFKIILIFLLVNILFIPYSIGDDIDIETNTVLEEIATSSNFSEEPVINSRRAVVFERNSKCVIYNKNMDEKCAMASTTKIMTCIVILENWTFILYFDSHNFRNFVLFS